MLDVVSHVRQPKLSLDHIPFEGPRIDFFVLLMSSLSFETRGTNRVAGPSGRVVPTNEANQESESS